jgi:hypothetical protein
MRFPWHWASIVIAVTLFTGGCGGAVPDEELGEIIYEVPALPEAKQPLEMPRLDPPKKIPVAGPAAPPTP